MAKDPYEDLADRYREKVAFALREGGVGAASADRAVREWPDLVRTSAFVNRSPRVVAGEIARYEGLSYRAPARVPARAVARKLAAKSRKASAELRRRDDERERFSSTRNYEYLIYPSPRVSGEGVKVVPSSIGDKRSLDEAKRLARATPGAGIYSVTRGRFVGWINHDGRYVPTSRG